MRVKGRNKSRKKVKKESLESRSPFREMKRNEKRPDFSNLVLEMFRERLMGKSTRTVFSICSDNRKGSWK